MKMPVCVKRYDEFGVTLKLMDDKTLRFRYRYDADRTFEFSLLCEVGQPFQPSFLKLLKTNGLELGETMELNEKPWLADTLKAK